MTPDRTHKVVSSRLTLHVTEWGDPEAPPIVLQHGGRDHARSWDRFAAGLKKDYRVIAPDLRGHGDSEWVSDGEYHAMDMIYDFANFFDALELPPCPVIGHSFGGAIAMRYAGVFPDRFSRFVNIEGLSASPDLQAKWDAVDMATRIKDWIVRRRRMHGWTPKHYADVAAVTARLIEEDPRLDVGVATNLAAQGTRSNADGSVSLKYDPAFDGNPPVDIDMATRQFLWRRVKFPVLFIYGRQSFASNPAEDGRLDHFHDARVEMIENAGHWAHHDQFDVVMALVRTFLAEDRIS